ncbi:28S ribosomal protein S23, mitochondrial isoform X2 [Mobula hypostoma]|uniref:28S ribosomal protein S23, mitochondrial isoform X2 n=1 Tax=Mobula hypostoma TaxID=723540 RepID=UPI002FC2CB68
MAGSRLEKFGSVFTRVRDLLRSGVLKESEKPIWYDVYATFPPKREPIYRKPRERFGKAQDPVQEIFYQEDVIRAKFYKVYGNGPRAFDLARSNFVSTCQRFVEKYQALEAEGETDEEKLFEGASRALLAEGIILRRWASTKNIICATVVPLQLKSVGVQSSVPASSISPKSLLSNVLSESVPQGSALDSKLQDMPKDVQEEDTEKASHPQ